MKEYKNKLTEDLLTNQHMASSEGDSNFNRVRQKISSMKAVITKHFPKDFRLIVADQTSVVAALNSSFPSSPPTSTSENFYSEFDERAIRAWNIFIFISYFRSIKYRPLSYLTTDFCSAANLGKVH